MNTLAIVAGSGTHPISRHIYGHFAEHLGRCIYEGIWVGEDSPIPNTRGIRNDVINALRNLKMPNLRWPGGCFADTYHWKDGIGPRESRPSIVNIHWGGVTETNHFGTHEFFDLCDMLDCEPYICGNVGSGTVQEMAEWLEYITMPAQSPMANLRRKNGREDAWPLKYWGVGNENWGCGGNMRAQYYADEYRRYASYCRNFSGQPLYKVACGFGDEWNEILMRDAHSFMDGLSVHYYTNAGTENPNRPATGFPVDQWFGTFHSALGIEHFIRKTRNIMDRYDPKKRVGMIVDEWGTWFNVEPGTNPGFLYQQNSIRDALVAGLSLNIFNNHADRVHMANIAQTINVLQSMILTEGPRMLLTPTYHVFEMYRVHQDATLLPSTLECEDSVLGEYRMAQLHASASRSQDGRIHVSICNLDLEKTADVNILLKGTSSGAVTGRILAADTMDAHNTFDHPDKVHPVPFEDVRMDGARLIAQLPAMSVTVLEITPKG